MEELEGTALLDMFGVGKESNDVSNNGELYSPCSSLLMFAIDCDYVWFCVFTNSQEVIEGNYAEVTNGLALGT